MSTPASTPRPRRRRRHPAAGARRIVGVGSATAMVAITAGLAATSALAEQPRTTATTSVDAGDLVQRGQVTQQLREEDDDGGLLAWLLDQSAQASPSRGATTNPRPQTATRGS